MTKVILGLLLLCFLISISGCQTVKGAGTDIYLGWEALKKADEWFQERYW